MLGVRNDVPSRSQAATSGRWVVVDFMPVLTRALVAAEAARL